MVVHHKRQTERQKVVKKLSSDDNEAQWQHMVNEKGYGSREHNAIFDLVAQTYGTDETDSNKYHKDTQAAAAGALLAV